MSTYLVDPAIITLEGHAIIEPGIDDVDVFGESTLGDTIDVQFIDGKWFSTGKIIRMHIDNYGTLWEVAVDWDGARAIVVEERAHG